MLECVHIDANVSHARSCKYEMDFNVSVESMFEGKCRQVYKHFSQP